MQEEGGEFILILRLYSGSTSTSGAYGRPLTPPR
jgi:hypothetical protein